MTDRVKDAKRGFIRMVVVLNATADLLPAVSYTERHPMSLPTWQLVYVIICFAPIVARLPIGDPLASRRDTGVGAR